jgi:TRAP-type uncharacterized transport system substrate-binding protein
MRKCTSWRLPAPRRIHTLANLDGKTVAVDLPDGGTFVTAINVFERLGIRPHRELGSSKASQRLQMLATQDSDKA